MAKEVVPMKSQDVDLEMEDVPSVQTTSKGRVSQSLEFLAKAYEARHEGKRKTRWVFSPINKPELSNVIGRKMDGWKVVAGKDLPEAMELLGTEELEIVRQGDVILMWNTPEKLKELRAEVDERTKEQAASVQRSHEDGMKKVGADDPKMRPEHEVRAKGTAQIEVKEVQIDYTQRKEEG